MSFFFFFLCFLKFMNGDTTRDGVLPTPKNVGENEKYVGKGYPDVQHGVGKSIERNAPGEALPTPIYASTKVVSGIPHSRRTLCRRTLRRREFLFSDVFFPTVYYVGNSIIYIYILIFYFYYFP